MNNYHTHTERCKHAVGSLLDYVAAAVERGVVELGISDHVPFPDGRWLEVRMEYQEKAAYYAELKKAQEKYPGIHLLKAFECEYVKEWHNYYQDELKAQDQCDYLILAGHIISGTSPWDLKGENRTPLEDLKGYTNYIVSGMESGIFDFIAHPDVFGDFYMEWDEEAKACTRYILEAASTYKIPLEINGYGFRKNKISTSSGMRYRYPLTPFWEMASAYDIQVLANSDAHRPQDIIGNIEDGKAIAEQYGISYIERIALKPCQHQ